eukprot:gene17269-20594_t
MSAGALVTYIDTNYTIKSRNITNVEKQLIQIMSKTDPPLKDIDTFKYYVEENEKKFRPPGSKIHEYSVFDTETGEDTNYEVYFGRISDPAVLRYHEKLQVFVMWYIDGSSYIFTDDTNWDVFFIFEKRIIDADTRYGIVGYCTVYSFYHHPSTSRERISQFLVLPPYQRMGHGRHLFNSIYNYYKSNESVYGPVYDVTVEDPADNFITLRNTVDLQNIMENDLFKDITADVDLSGDHSQLFENIRKKLLIASIYLLSKLVSLPQSNAAYKRFRVYIKKRLYKQFIGSDVAENDQQEEEKVKNKEEIEENKKKVIIELYNQLEQDYLQSIKSSGISA